MGASALHVRDEAGMTLVELMVALVVFGIAATGIAYTMIAATNTTRLDRNRVQAANLAAREIEATRSEFANAGDGATTLGNSGTVTNPHPLPAGSAPELSTFTVTRTVQWIPAGAGTSACDGGATVTYPSLAVDVTVTWPRMDNVKPVVSHTVLTPPKNSLNSELAFVGIKVLRANGTPAAGQAVKLTGPSTVTTTTAADGCAVFSLTVFGSYQASLATTGYVDNYGIPNPSKTIIVNKSELSQASFYYDRAATLNVTASTTSGYALPATLPNAFQLYNTGIQPAGIKSVPSTGSTTTVTGLWPFSDGYALWSGTCSQSDPVKAGGARQASTVLAPGATGTAQLWFFPVSVHVVNVDGVPLAGATVVANPTSTLGCMPVGSTIDSQNWVLGKTASDGTLLTSLPAGSWTLSIAGRNPDGTWPDTPSLVPGGAPADVTARIDTLS